MVPMCRVRHAIARTIVLISFFLVVVFSQAAFASTISGFVYDKNRVPLPLVDVELLNENYQLRNRTKTDGVGRYTFGGLADGRYTVRVLPFRYDLEDQDAMVEVTTIATTGTGQGNTFITQDFYLSPKKGGLAAAEAAVIFAQDVPPNARSLYHAAVDDLSKNRRLDGLRGLREAIAVYPRYFDALFRLGKELLAANEFGEAAQLFIKAAEVNPKSPMSLYYAGSALYALGADYHKGAIVALKAALEFAPASVQVLYLLGKLERAAGDLQNAEKHLLQAKKASRQGVAEIHKELAQLYGNDLKRFDAAATELEGYIKTSKLSPEEERKTKEVIANLRQKAKTQRSN